jgi:hypothetical protein
MITYIFRVFNSICLLVIATAVCVIAYNSHRMSHQFDPVIHDDDIHPIVTNNYLSTGEWVAEKAAKFFDVPPPTQIFSNGKYLKTVSYNKGFISKIINNARKKYAIEHMQPYSELLVDISPGALNVSYSLRKYYARLDYLRWLTRQKAMAKSHEHEMEAGL